MELDKQYEQLSNKLKNKNEKIDLSEANPNFVRLNELLESYWSKQRNGELVTKEEREISLLSINSLETVFHFGVHKGQAIREVLKRNPQYLLWCITDMNHFALDLEIMLNSQLVRDWKYHKAFEINLMKVSLLRKQRKIQDEEEGLNSSESSYENYDEGYEDDFDDLFGDHAGVARINLD